MAPRILAVCTGGPRPIGAKSGHTGHFKTPQMGAVEVTATGLLGDTIVDTAHHGGPEQAVYIFCEDDRAHWEGQLGLLVSAGFFGENLLIDGLAGADLALGDRLIIGNTTLQITAPRIPCVTFAARIGDPNGVSLFNVVARPGAYARVLKTGAITSFDPVTHLPFDGDRISVPDHFRRYVQRNMDRPYLKRLVDIPCHSQIRETARATLGIANPG